MSKEQSGGFSKKDYDTLKKYLSDDEIQSGGVDLNYLLFKEEQRIEANRKQEKDPK